MLETPPDPDRTMMEHRLAESGIYEIVNLVNGKRYVGSACNLKQRKIDHWKTLRRGTHHSRYLQASWNKYGEEAFEFRLIEFVAEKADLVPREQHFFDTLSPEYNIAKQAGSCLGVRHTAEAKAKMSKFHKGKKLSPEHIAKIVESNRGRKHSPEAVARMKASQRRRVEQNPEYLRELLERQAFLSTDPGIRKKRSLALRGRPSPLKGKKQDAERVKRRAEFHRGRKRSAETCAKISAAMAGKKRPPRSEEHRANLSKAMKGRQKSPEHMAALQAARRCRIYTEEQRARLREHAAKRWASAGAKAFGR